jgi:hypothetical protein
VWQELGEFFTSLKARSVDVRVDVPVEVKEVSGVEEQSHA